MSLDPTPSTAASVLACRASVIARARQVLDQLESSGQLPHIPVYVDSPLSVNATTVFGAHPECFDNDLNEYKLTDDRALFRCFVT